MATAREIRRRVFAVKKTQQITKAMKMVATVRFKKAQEARERSKPYLIRMAELMGPLRAVPHVFGHPLCERRKVVRWGAVVISSEKGMCGSFNSSLFRFVMRRLADELEAGKHVELVVIGRKGQDFFKRTPYPIRHIYTSIPSTFDAVSPIADQLIQWFTDGSVDQWVLLSNKFLNVMQARLTDQVMLPIPYQRDPFDAGHGRGPWSLSQGRPERGEAEAIEPDHLFEPSFPTVVDWTLRHAIHVQLFSAMLESQVSENGIRMSMMDQATTKAGDVIKELTIQLNKARQASITKELIEITAAVESMK